MNREHAWITIKCILARPAAAGCSLLPLSRDFCELGARIGLCI